jgi:hypothetical protein
VNSTVEDGNLRSTMVVESTQNVNSSTLVHRRIVIIYLIGALVFLSINAVVDTYIFVSSS